MDHIVKLDAGPAGRYFTASLNYGPACRPSGPAESPLGSPLHRPGPLGAVK